MKWENNRRSDNVEDRRGASGGGGLGGRSIGLGTVVVALVAGWVFGINPLTILGLLSGADMGPAATQQAPAGAPPANDRQAQFVSTVLADTEDVWTRLFKEQGTTYAVPRLVLFRGATPTACGQGQSAMGPFYCPLDQRVYIDLAFYDTLRQQLGAPGDFAQAYVIAHEVGHHVQNLLGVLPRVEQLKRGAAPAEANRLSVRVELQADCLAGVWAQQARSNFQLEPADIEEALNAASRIGDDTLQKQGQGHVVPESFTHGTSAQRVRWFSTGYERGTLAACDTFDSPI
ncbi:neutral zinc metallopeptidase [Comamonadaceae bacterium PP-2]